MTRGEGRGGEGDIEVGVNELRPFGTLEGCGSKKNKRKMMKDEGLLCLRLRHSQGQCGKQATRLDWVGGDEDREGTLWCWDDTFLLQCGNEVMLE